MKFIIFIAVLVPLIVFISVAVVLRQGLRTCAILYQDSIDTIATQWQAVLADRYNSCTSSYEVLTDWDACVTIATAKVNDKVLPFTLPVVSSFMRFFQEERKDIGELKVEHDERCSGYTEFLFYPPEPE